MKYIYILLLFSCTTQLDNTLFSISEKEKSSYIVLSRPEFPDDYHQIQYVGDWVHMTIEKNGKTGSYAGTNQDTARFKFWGYGVQIRTELWERHKSYQVIIDGKFIESINVENPINTTHNLTYSNMDLKPMRPDDHNHVLELVPDGGYFVLNTLTIHYYVDPTTNEDCIPDTVYLPSDPIIIHDTVYRFKPDTLDLKIFIKEDSIWFELN